MLRLHRRRGRGRVEVLDTLQTFDADLCNIPDSEIGVKCGFVAEGLGPGVNNPELQPQRIVRVIDLIERLERMNEGDACGRVLVRQAVSRGAAVVVLVAEDPGPGEKVREAVLGVAGV